MRGLTIVWGAASLLCSWATISAAAQLEEFQPPAVWENSMLVHTVNVDRSYPREIVNVVITNISPQPQSKYFITFPTDVADKLSSLETKSKTDAKLQFPVVRRDTDESEDSKTSKYQYYEVTLPTVQPQKTVTVTISYLLLNSTVPLPSKIQQGETQFLSYQFSSYFLSPYQSASQKTKIRFPAGSNPEYTKLERPASRDAEAGQDPTQQGPTYTYGPYVDVQPLSVQPISVRYKFINPSVYSSLLERDVHVSHWDKSLEIEERYWIENLGASLREPFNRLQYQASEVSKPAFSPAIRRLSFPLLAGATDAYFVDTIGNVSTSNFRSNNKEALLELKPRYPIFGGWKYSFKIGWTLGLNQFLNNINDDQFVLRVPFLEGPKLPVGIQYGQVQIRVILPEGATNVKFETTAPISSSEITFHKAFLDTVGRTCLVLNSSSLTDEWRGTELVLSYTYSWAAFLRKPVVVTAGVVVPFLAFWLVSKIDVGIKAKRA